MVDSFVLENDLITLDPEIKARWVSDLRSGNYKQTFGKLHDERGYCCLGVLCEQAVEGGIVSSEEQEKVGGRFITYYTDVKDDRFTISSSLPDAVVNWAGVKTANNLGSAYGKLPFKDRNGSQAYLDGLNDYGLPFNQIADLIEFWY